MEGIGMAGIAPLIGVDISGSLKTGVSFTTLVGGRGTPADTVYGVYAGLGKKGLNVMSAAERNDYLRAMEFASPAFLEAALKAYRMADQGAITASGKALTDEHGNRSALSLSHDLVVSPTSHLGRFWGGSMLSSFLKERFDMTAQKVYFSTNNR